MKNVLAQVPEGGRVLVIRLRSLGDCVLTTPAFALLKQYRPDIQIGVVVEDRFAAVYQGNPDIAAILSPNVPAVTRWRPHLCLNLHGGTRSIALTTASGARLRAGFGHFRAAAIYNVRIPTAQEILGVDRVVHTAEHVASAVFHLGVPQSEIPRAKLVAAPAQTRAPYAVLHPLASAPDKTWPPDRFLAIAGHLRTVCSIEPIVIGGPGDDLTPFVEHRILLGASLEKIKSLMPGATLFVGNDSGPAHMAAAFGVPVVVLFGNSDSRIWGPWRTESVVLESPEGIGAIAPEEVTAAVEKLQVKA